MRHLYDSLRACAKEEEVKAETRFDGTRVDCAYDAAGNKLAKTDAGGTVSYTLGAGDRLASWTGGSYSHDTAGCVTHIVRGADTLDLTWNGQYQLVSVSTNGAFAESYAYDALGRRVSTTTLEGTIRHVYDGVQCIADIDGNGDVVASYTWGAGIDNLLAIHTGDATYYPLTDIQGTIWGYVDANNAIVARFDYDAWGNILSATSSIPALATNRYRFQCREWSAATGLVNFRAASGLETWGMAKLVATLNSLKHRAAMLALEYANCPNPELLKQIEELERQAAMIQKAINEASAKNDRDRLPRPRRTRYR